MNELNENLNNTTEENSSASETPQAPQMPEMPKTQPETVQENEVVEEKEAVQEKTEAQTEPQPRPQQAPPQPPRPPFQGNPYQQPPRPQGNPYVSAYGNPQQRPPYQQGQPYTQPYQNNPYAQPQAPDYYRMTYGVPKPEKQKMSGGLKALIIIVIAILVAFVAGLAIYMGFGAVQIQQQSSQNNSGSIFGDYFDDFGGDYYFQNPTSPTFSQEQSSDQSYDESDASDKINPDFKGVELQEKPKDKSSSKYNASYSFQKLQDAVVGIVCYYEEDEESDTYQSQGTGIIITSDGYIVTNSHVIGNSRKAYLIKVIMADKKEYKAGVVGYDSRSDVAVLKIDAKNLPVASFGDSDLTEITEDVIAIGNPSGIEFQNSVTRGIVSALERKVSSSNNVEFMQIDAAINPGNSGGPVCNMYGQVIGIATSKIAAEEYEGMGFAIPSATVKELVDDIIRNGYVTNRVKVGITGTAVDESSAGASGIQIVSITEGGPMDVDGVQVNDIITAVDGEKVTTFSEIYDILEKHSEGDKVKVTLYRPSTQKSSDVEITLQIDKADN